MNTIITGAGKGIGYSLVNKFLSNAKPNDCIFGLSRSIERLKDLNYNGIKIIPIKCDITNQKEVENAMTTISNNCDNVDFLINNAGFLVNKPFNEILNADIDQIFNTNFKGPLNLIQKLFPLLNSSKKAHIVNISSMGGFQGAAKFAGLSAYSSSKAALNCLTECLAVEFQSTSIKINALCLGAVETEMLSKAFPDFKASINAEEMAQFIYLFTHENHHYMNGKVIPVSLSTP
jgi:NAD(P)-dependent dehydrogenase (short-subunit alcohol dehydrogenase family)